MLEYALEHFEQEELWLVDSLQIFDPFYLSRHNPFRARRLLHAMKIARPFTIYQLKDKLFTLTKIKLHEKSTILVSGIDKFDEDISNKRELEAIHATMKQVLEGLIEKYRCKIFVGVREKELS